MLWEIELDGAAFVVRYGPAGQPLETYRRDFPSVTKTTAAMEEFIASRIKDGYTRIEDGTPAPARPERTEERNPELEAAIREHPDDPEPYLVYADWLQARGDPRGELITLQHAALGAEGAAGGDLAQRIAEHLAAHADWLCGPLARYPEAAQLTWHLGFIRAARLQGDLDEEDVTAQDLLGTLCELSSARFLQELTFGVPSYGDEVDYQPVIDALVEHGERPGLRRLTLGDFLFPDECEMSWSSVGDVSPLFALYPRLEALELQGGSVTLGEIRLPELRRFEVRTGGLSRASIRSIAGASWPRLEELSVWFGDPYYGAEATVEDLAPILDAEGLPRLRRLGLKNANFTDELIPRLAGSRVLRQLEQLDLSMGTLTDEGAESLDEHRQAFAHLARLDLDDNQLDEQGRLVADLCGEVNIGRQRDSDDRYVSVGE
jgi:uncharacterized protein (TIGR02996 family)